MTPSFCPLSRFARVAAVLSLSLLIAASTALAQPVPRPAPPDPLVRMNESIDALTRKVWPSVVQILVSSYGPRNEGPQGERRRRHREAAVHRLGVRDRPGGLHHDERARGETARTASRLCCPQTTRTGRSRRRCPAGRDCRRADRRHHHRTGSGGVESRGPETPGAAAGDLLTSPPGRDGICVRQPQRAPQQLDPWAGLSRGATGEP